MERLHRYRRVRDVVRRSVAGEVLLIPIAIQADMETIFTLNETADLVWSLLDGERTLQDVVEQILSAYEVTEEAAWADLKALIRNMQLAGVVEKCL